MLEKITWFEGLFIHPVAVQKVTKHETNIHEVTKPRYKLSHNLRKMFVKGFVTGFNIIHFRHKELQDVRPGAVHPGDAADGPGRRGHQGRQAGRQEDGQAERRPHVPGADLLQGRKGPQL